MRHVKNFKKHDIKFQLEVDFFVRPYSSSTCKYSILSFLCKGPGQRKWRGVFNLENDYKYRALSMDDRNKYFISKVLTVLSKEELNEAFIELHEKLKPELITKT